MPSRLSVRLIAPSADKAVDGGDLGYAPAYDG